VNKKAAAPAVTSVHFYDRYVSTSRRTAAHKLTGAEHWQTGFVLTTDMRRLTTFRSTTERIYDGDPKTL